MKLVAYFYFILFTLSSSFAQKNSDSLLVFVGEKIRVDYVPNEPPKKSYTKAVQGNDTVTLESLSISMDNKYEAKYKIKKLIYGSYLENIIEFTTFDHYGIPPFSKFKTVLLFVSKHDGKLYHEKYQYFDLYMTKVKKWASPYSSDSYEHPYRDSVTVKPERITFNPTVSFPLDGLTREAIEQKYPRPYYQIKKGRAIAIYGNYVDDLFKLKQQTVLKARGLF